MKSSRLMCLWLLATLAVTLPAAELEARDPAAAEFDGDKLELDAPISRYLPELAEIKVLVETKGDDGETRHEEVPVERAITVRDLLRHTSGFTYGFFGNSEVDKRYKSSGILVTDRTLEDTVKKLSQIPLKHQPGIRWLKPAHPMQSYRFVTSSNRFYSGGGGWHAFLDRSKEQADYDLHGSNQPNRPTRLRWRDEETRLRLDGVTF